ncbi:hypothetical protein EYV94_20385 [Puteibacter caeruleilacunae]|nr:hypothetical protein EYV94_20385 [Puteibacter caeruleilacunae]
MIEPRKDFSDRMKCTMWMMLLSLIPFGIGTLSAQNTKLNSIRVKRQELSQQSFRHEDLDKKKAEKLKDCIALLKEDGTFSDLHQKEITIEQKDTLTAEFDRKVNEKVSVKAFLRLWRLAEGVRKGKIKQEKLKRSILKGYVHYGKLETGRVQGWNRFHSSCFLIPRSAINAYFCFFKEMESVEQKTCTDSLVTEAHKYICEVGMQSWTQPLREDYTDKNVVQVERFRGHVWWVGGNALGYRSLYECALMMSSPEMIDVLAEVSKKALSSVSQSTYDEAFWIEGFTADGAGWGHGKQCLIWGYPIHGTEPALELLHKLSGTPWEQKLSGENVEVVLNYIRGSAFYFHKGIEPPCLSRKSMTWYDRKKTVIPSIGLAQNLVSNWKTSLTPSEFNELKEFIAQAKKHDVNMIDYPEGNYHGTRYFFNNDNLIKKEEDYYAYISMASNRCDGIESAHTMADNYNLFTCDGMTLFQKKGDEYREATGAWNLTAIPGVTSRQGEEHLKPITNWGGFNSKYNYAGAATHNGPNACAGFKFLKNNARPKSKYPNDFIFGVEAYKSYFWIGDNLLALGAGITNKQTGLSHPIWTTIDQTISQSSEVIKYHKKLKPSKANIQIIKKAGEKNKDINWVKNNGFTYGVIPQYTHGEVGLIVENRPTKWNKLSPVNKSIKGKSENVDIFQLWINHGNNPQNSSYAYMVNCKGEVPTAHPKILSNNTSLQAVKSCQDDILQAVFYDEKAILKDDSNQLKVSDPCILMLENQDSQLLITICDPRMNEKLDSITIYTKQPLFERMKKSQNGWYEMNIKLPKGAQTGKPVTQAVSCNLYKK